jgi:crossover junction endodeoxyribonuclease RusA
MYRGGRRFLTSKGREIKDEIGTELLVQRNSGPLAGPVALNVLFYFPNKRRRDIDNCLKALLDCMTGILYLDDSQIDELHVYKQIDTKNPRTVVQVL